MKMREKMTKSLQEVNNTVPIPSSNASFFRKLFAFSGPGALVAVGYMDPGNWITSIQGGALYGYLLLSVILLSSLIAMLLQAMCSKLGIVTGMDLAQATRTLTGKKGAFILWVIAELAIMATDVAEVIGTAIALNLLFGMPLMLGVLLTLFDVFLLLLCLSFGLRKIEAFVFTLILTIFLIFAYEVMLASPHFGDIVRGFIPQKEIFTASLSGQDSALLIALGIVGATVMPHNLYLHSSLVQSRQYDRKTKEGIKDAIKFSIFDSNLQLTFSFVINCLLLILGAALFFGHDPEQLGRFSQLYHALENPAIVGSIASGLLATLFAVALLASGQNSTITGTLTGQIVMEGFVNLKVPAWLRRFITRALATLPIFLAIYFWGDREDVIEGLLIYSQVFLSIALPVSMIPLIWITSNKKWMGEFVNSKLTIAVGVISTTLLVGLNIQLIIETANKLFG